MTREGLDELLDRPGFTPGRGDVPALVQLVITGNERAITAIAALGALAEVGAALDTQDDGAAVRLVQAIGLMARVGRADARAKLIALVGEARARVRRAAIIALGKVGAVAAREGGNAQVELRDGERRAGERRAGDAPVRVELRDDDTRRITERRTDDDLSDVRTALLARWDAAEMPPEERRALAEALGKVGGEAALAVLRALAPGTDKELARLRDRAMLMASRGEQRAEDSHIAIEVAPPEPVVVSLGCRPGLGALLGEELRDLGIAATARGDGARLELRGPWSTLHASRLWERAAIVMPAAGDLVRTLTSERVMALLRAWTRGPIRWRLDAAGRAKIWKQVQAVSAAAPELVNDPSATTWEVQTTDSELVLIPKRIADPRFAYRVAEVPAASHGSVAAAIVFAARLEPGARVWDPFCGSGVELVEAAKRGAGAVIGSDLDEDALAAARANCAAAGVTAELVRGDAAKYAPAGPIDAIVTNPPLGSRVHVDAVRLLVAALPNLARALRPGGKLVWITPRWRATAPAAEHAGLVIDNATDVDLGGVRGRLERWNKR